MKRMLINATQEEELRMALVDGQRLYDLNIELPASERKKANIYKGKITRIEPSLEAAFVDFGAERHGFLPLKEVSSEYFVKPAEPGKKPNIRDVLNEGQDIVVQIDKEERGNKGAALTTYVSLAGRFIVLKPNKARSGGVSRRIVGSDRDLARESLDGVEIPDGMSVILRTAGIDRSPEELTWDIENLMQIWQAILSVVLQRPSPFLIYRESNSIVRALRDYMAGDIGEVLIDNEATYKEAVEFVEQVMPHNLRKLKHYSDPVPLFTRFQIESQIESAFAHAVSLPSGGSIVIDHTEALVSIDINSARATKGGDIEATALNTNLEAADEIARQLRIRDLGGLIVIDFIDMGPQKHQREVENRLREAVRQDRARVQIGKISRFGLLEMSRQRLRPSLGESSYLTCPRCSGHGTIRSVESLALAILRIIGEEARKERTAKVIAQLPVEVATYLLNEKRDWVNNVESRHDTQVILVANPSLETPHYEVRRVRDDQTDMPENVGTSYEMAQVVNEPELPVGLEEKKAAEVPAIAQIKPTTPAPMQAKARNAPAEKASSKGLWATIVAWFSGEDDEKPARKGSKGKDSKRGGAKKGRGQRRGDSQRSGDERRSKRGSKKRPAKKKASKKKTAKKKTSDGRKTQAQDSQGGPAKDDTQSGSTRSGRSRRSRGGRRRRRDSGDRPEQDKAAQQSKAAPDTEQKAGDSGQRQAPPKTDQPTPEKRADQPERKPRPKKEPKAEAKADAQTDSRPDAPAEKPAAKPVDAKPADKPQARADKPAEKPQSRPEKPADPRPEKPADAKPADKPAAKQADKPAEARPADKPAAKSEPSRGGASEKPAKPPAQGGLLPWDTPSAKPVDKPAPKPESSDTPPQN